MNEGATRNDRIAGWARPINSRKWHWFASGSARSVCGRWLFFGKRRDPAADHHPENCAACRRKKPAAA